MGDREQQAGSCAVGRGGTEEVRVVRNRLMCVVCLLLGTCHTQTCHTRLLPVAISGSVISAQLGSVLASVAYVAI